MIVSFEISGLSSQFKWFQLRHVRANSGINLPQVNFEINKIKELYPFIEEDKLQVILHSFPRLLIGSNNAGLIVPLKTFQYAVDGL